MTIVSFQLKSATTQSNAPFCLGHCFKKGDVPAGSSIIANIADFQATTVNTWPDGSVRIAILAGRASLTAGVALTVPLSLGTPTGGTNLTTADLKATGITANISTGALGASSWATVAWDAVAFGVPWVVGPKMSSWIYRKQVGTDAHLVAWQEVRLWSGGEVEVLPWIENGYWTVPGPTNKNDTYTFTLGGTSRFSGAIDLKHHQRTPLLTGTILSHWLSADPGVTPIHDKAYMQASEVVPTYSLSGLPAYDSSHPFLAATPTTHDSLATTWAPLDKANFIYESDSMAPGGYHSPIGLLPTHDAAYLVCATQHELLYGAVVRNGYAAGRYCIHFRDETTNRPPLLSAYPEMGLTGGNDRGIKDVGGQLGGYTPDVTGGNGALYDVAHSPSMGFMAFLLTGRFYFKEEAQFQFIANHFATRGPNRAGQRDDGIDTGVFPGMSGASGLCVSFPQPRSGAWRLRTLAQNLMIVPDSGDPMRAELIASMEANCTYFHAVYVAQANNPYGIVACGGGYSTNPSDPKYIAAWQEDFSTAAWGWALAADLPISSTAKTKMAAFFQWKGKSIVHRLGTSAGFRFESLGGYVYAMAPTGTPDMYGGTGPWYANDAAVYAATHSAAAAAAIPDNAWQNQPVTDNVINFNYQPAASVEANALPAIAYAVRHAVPGAAAGYARLLGASNWSTMTASQTTDAPVWAIAPSGQASGVTLPAPTGPSIAVSTGLINGKIAVKGYSGSGLFPPQFASGFAERGRFADDIVGALSTDQFTDDIGTIPAGLTFTPYQNGSFTASGADGSYTVPRTLWKNGVSSSSPLYLNFGTVTPPPTPTVTGVTATPATASVTGGGTVQITTSVQGLYSPSQTGVWTKRSGVGTMSSSSLYQAVAAGISDQVSVFRFTSDQDNTRWAEVTITILAADQSTISPRFARPTSDISKGAWVPSTGTDLYAMIDEVTADATDYIAATTPTTARIKLGGVTDPGTSINQVLRYQAWSPTGGSLTVRLMQGGSLIATWTHLSLPTTPSLIAQVLTSGQCDAITDYTNLFVEFAAA